MSHAAPAATSMPAPMPVHSESALLKFFLPGLVVGMILGSMLGLYVGARGGNAKVMPPAPGQSGGVAAASAEDDRTQAQPPVTPPADASKPAGGEPTAPAPAPAPADETAKPADSKPADPAPAGKP